MNKKENFDWMLVGGHPVSDVAAAYFPGVRPDSATRTFRNQIHQYPALYKTLCEAGYTDHLHMLLPVHIAAIVRAWMMPGAALREAERISLQEE